MIAGRYVLEREIGRGGMGAVWLGRDEILGREVALKRIGMVPGAGSPDLERAEREAKLAARLNHPHVVAVYDLVEEDDHQWLVMEHVDGLNLAALVRRDGPLPVDRAAALVGQAAEALTQAHAAGIVHRDVKPSNILVTPSGQVKLTDFGIARAEADASLTQTGLVTGSPAYLAPEVATGRMATDASDVWSLGATLYHALEGRPPYETGDNVLGAMYRIVHEDPPRPTYAGWLAPLMLATMAKDPADRWSMQHVHQFLARGPGAALAPPPPVASQPSTEETSVLTATPGVPPPPVRPGARHGGRRLPPWVALVAVACVVAIVVAVAALVLNRDGDGDPSATQDPTPGSGSSAGSSAASTPPSEPTATASSSADAERASEMTLFVTDYLNTVVADPRGAWERLTPQFQADSGGFGQYNKFWRGYDTARITAIGADPATLVVSYEVTYGAVEGKGFTDTVELQLEESGDSYLIAGEA